jgi:hypothetical protein
VNAAGRALWLAVAGLVLGPLAWVVSTEIGTFLPALFCRDWPRWGVGLVGLCIVATLAGAVFSWRSHRVGEGTLRFTAALGALLALLLALPVALHLIAALVLSGCEP